MGLAGFGTLRTGGRRFSGLDTTTRRVRCDGTVPASSGGKNQYHTRPAVWQRPKQQALYTHQLRPVSGSTGIPAGDDSSRPADKSKQPRLSAFTVGSGRNQCGQVDHGKQTKGQHPGGGRQVIQKRFLNRCHGKNTGNHGDQQAIESDLYRRG